jgi:hypothetical protein
MSIDPLQKNTLTLAQAAKQLPSLRKGRPISSSTLWRWALRGLRGVRLTTAKIGGVRVTTEDALREFFAKLSALDTVSGQTSEVISEYEQKQIDRELDAARI